MLAIAPYNAWAGYSYRGSLKETHSWVIMLKLAEVLASILLHHYFLIIATPVRPLPYLEYYAYLLSIIQVGTVHLKGFSIE